MGMAKRRGGRLFIKGHSKLGGRVKGTPNKATQALIDAQKAAEEEVLRAKAEFQAAMAGEMKFTPLQVMHAVMLLRIGKGDHDGALAAAKEAAPYVHARLAMNDLRVQHTLAGKSDAEISVEIEELRHKIARSRQQPPLIETNLEPVTVAAET
jgi:hypothetical protein